MIGHGHRQNGPARLLRVAAQSDVRILFASIEDCAPCRFRAEALCVVELWQADEGLNRYVCRGRLRQQNERRTNLERDSESSNQCALPRRNFATALRNCSTVSPRIFSSIA